MKRHNISDDDVIDESSEDEVIARKPPARKKVAREVTPTKQPKDYIQWVDKHLPNSISEICINPTKLKQVRSILEKMVNKESSCRLLVLSGPAGSSKSTTVKLLARELLTNRKGLATTLVNLEEDLDCIEYLDLSVPGTAQPTHFGEFLNDCKYRSGCVVLVEELPNVFHEDTLRNFRHAIREWVHSSEPHPPLVLCVTEIEYGSENRFAYHIENNMSVETLLGVGITSLPEVERVKFNPVANKFLKKTVNALVRSEKSVFNAIPQPIVTRFIDDVSKCGDVRSVIANLQMWATSYTAALSVGEDDKHTRSEYALMNLDVFSQSYARENQIDLFHAVGKIIYLSSDFGHMSENDNDFYSVQSVLERYNRNNLGLLNLAVLENYHVYKDSNYDIEVASRIVDGLSLGDVLHDEEYGIRNARAQLREVGPATATHKLRVKFPRHYKMMREFSKTAQRVRNYQRWIDPHAMFDAINMVEGYFRPMILNKKHRKRFMYDRIGGRFKEIYAEDEVAVDDKLEDADEGTPVDQFQIEINENMAREETVDEDDELSDPIDNSDDDNSTDWSDDELDMLISQGKV